MISRLGGEAEYGWRGFYRFAFWASDWGCTGFIWIGYRLFSEAGAGRTSGACMHFSTSLLL